MVLRRYHLPEKNPWDVWKTILANWRETFDKRPKFLRSMLQKGTKVNCNFLKKISPKSYHGLSESVYYNAAEKFLTKTKKTTQCWKLINQFFLGFLLLKGSLWTRRKHLWKHYQKLVLEASVFYAPCAILTEKCICFWRSFPLKLYLWTTRKQLWQPVKKVW